MNLSGIYQKLTDREKDFILHVWNRDGKRHVSLAVLPFLSAKKTYDAVWNAQWRDVGRQWKNVAWNRKAQRKLEQKLSNYLGGDIG